LKEADMKKLFMALFFVLAFGISTLFAQTPYDVTIGWDLNTETDIKGYRLYQCPVDISTLDADGDGVVTLNELLAGGGFEVADVLHPTDRYSLVDVLSTDYWVLIAYDTAGYESKLSNIVSFGPGAPGDLKIITIITRENIP